MVTAVTEAAMKSSTVMKVKQQTTARAGRVGTQSLQASKCSEGGLGKALGTMHVDRLEQWRTQHSVLSRSTVATANAAEFTLLATPFSTKVVLRENVGTAPASRSANKRRNMRGGGARQAQCQQTMEYEEGCTGGYGALAQTCSHRAMGRGGG
jgi:hypothetical protein